MLDNYTWYDKCQFSADLNQKRTAATKTIEILNSPRVPH